MSDETKDLAQLAAKWIINILLGLLAKRDISIENSPVTPQRLSQLLILVKENLITETMGKTILEKMFDDTKSPIEICINDNAWAIESEYTKQIVNGFVAVNEDKAQQYRNGNQKLFGYFIGQIMSCAPGRLHSHDVNSYLKEAIA